MSEEAREVPEANEEMSSKDFEKLLRLAESDNVRAQFELGLALRNGWGADMDE